MLSPIKESASIEEIQQINNQTKFISNDNIIQKSLDTISLDENKRSVIINEAQPLARSSVLYLGTAIPSDDERGIDSIQEPLSKRYPIDGTEIVRGIEAWLSIDENGLQIQFPRDPSIMIYYPIRSLAYCAAIRFAIRTEAGVKFPKGWRFVPLDHRDAIQTENIQNPPLFAVSFHRTNNGTVDECHCFVAKTKQIALGLVEACYNAYQKTHTDQDCSKVPLYFKINNDGTKIKEIDNEISIVPALDKEKTLNYQTSRETAGYFYKPDQISIDNWHLGEPTKQGIQSSPSNQSINSSNRQNRPRYLGSLTSIPEPEKSIQSSSTNNSRESSVQLKFDPFAPDPNVLRVERIKDDHSGREIFVRWLRGPSEIPKQTLQSQIPNPDYHVNYNADKRQVEKKLLEDVQRLVLEEVFKKSVMFNDRPQAIPRHHEQKKSNKKHKHRKDHVIENRYEKQRSTILNNNNPPPPHYEKQRSTILNNNNNPPPRYEKQRSTILYNNNNNPPPPPHYEKQGSTILYNNNNPPPRYEYDEVINLPTITLSPTQQNLSIPQEIPSIQQQTPIINLDFPIQQQTLPVQQFLSIQPQQPLPIQPLQPLPVQQPASSIQQYAPIQQYLSIQQQPMPIQQYPTIQPYPTVQPYPTMQPYPSTPQYPSVQQYQGPQQQYMMAPYGMTYHTIELPNSQNTAIQQNSTAPIWFYM